MLSQGCFKFLCCAASEGVPGAGRGHYQDRWPKLARRMSHGIVLCWTIELVELVCVCAFAWGLTRHWSVGDEQLYCVSLALFTLCYFLSSLLLNCPYLSLGVLTLLSFVPHPTVVGVWANSWVETKSELLWPELSHTTAECCCVRHARTSLRTGAKRNQVVYPNWYCYCVFSWSLWQ